MTASGSDSQGRSASSAGAGRRAVFRQEADRLVLSNALVSLGFSASDGSLLSVYHRRTQVELVDSAEASARGVLWRLQITREGTDLAAVTNRGCGKFSYAATTTSDGSLQLRLDWANPRVGAAEVEGRVTAVITLPPDSGTCRFQLEAQLAEQVSLQELDFPCLCALGAADRLVEESLFLPLSGGLLIREPRAALAMLGEDASWQAAYPGPASLQMLGFSLAERTTAWLGAEDPAGARKTLVAAGLPGSSRLALWITHYPARRDDGLWDPGYPISLGLVMGDWLEAAREYRAWAVQQPWCARGRGGERNLPALTSSYGLWLSHWGDARHAVAAARELQRAVNVPIKLDWHCWHRCACGGAYPDYFPPRDGEQAFAEAKGRLAEAGVLTQISFNGLRASPQSEAWGAAGAGRYALATDEADAGSGLAVMCPGADYWRGKLVALARQAVQRGVEGVYLEELGESAPRDCTDPDHADAHSGPGSWAAGVRMALGEVKDAVGAGVHLATDGPAEPYLDVVDAFVSRHAAAEREGLFSGRFGSRWSAIPLFSAVYHGYATLIGPGSSLLNARPQDPMLPQAVSDARLPVSLMARDFTDQFCLEVARAAVWGQQLMLASFAPEQARDDSGRRKLSFLSTVLRAQAWGVGALLPYSQFMGLLGIESDELAVDLLVNPPQSAPAERHATRRSISPVLGSAWRTPGAGLALVLVNVHDQPVDFATRLRSSRLGLKLPLQLIGRTFSEDGDVPAATLRASGSEISGRLPGRSVVLLTLR